MTTRRSQWTACFCIPAVMLIATLAGVDQASSLTGEQCTAFCNRQISDCTSKTNRNDCDNVFDACVGDCSRCCPHDQTATCRCAPPDRINPRPRSTPPPQEQSPPPRAKPYINPLQQQLRRKACYDEANAKHRLCRNKAIRGYFIKGACDRNLKIDTEKCRKKFP